jgi:addiction module RelB/DinJ family antitoxin
VAQNQTDLTVRIDSDLKASGEELLRSLGISWSAAFSAFVSYSVRQGKVPFEVGDALGDPAALETEEEYYAELRRRREDMRAGRNCAVRRLLEVD